MPSAVNLTREPTIAVGLLDHVPSTAIRLDGKFRDGRGATVPAGTLTAMCRDSAIHCEGLLQGDFTAVDLTPHDVQTDAFSLETTIGIDFHWQQREHESFRGGLRLIPHTGDRLTVVNHVPLETYLRSVVCSEMKATSPPEFIKAHAVISRSWLLAQLTHRDESPAAAVARNEIIRWTDREAHELFDVCADDHCQRYQGIGRVDAPGVLSAVQATWGEVLCHEGMACDARFSKCCGGITEEFATAWSDRCVPYLVARWDRAGPAEELPQLEEDANLRQFLVDPPPAFCDCRDQALLGQVLNDYDLATAGFFRWRTTLSADEGRRLIHHKLGRDLGRLLDLQPMQRGPSGRLRRLRLVGENDSLIIGKELEIRRALSATHLYSSAFVVDREGPSDRPTAFVLQGAGWGHGVGLCQIGAAVMSQQGYDYREILQHYYPGADVQRLYK